MTPAELADGTARYHAWLAAEGELDPPAQEPGGEDDHEGTPMESWRQVWRDGFAHVLPTAGLVALRDALRADDRRLTQGSTTTPPPLMCVQDWPVEAACCIGFAGWQGCGLTTVGEVEEFFARVCFEADQRLGEPAACRWFLNWFDDTPRGEMRRDLAAECELAIRGRLTAPAIVGH